MSRAAAMPKTLHRFTAGCIWKRSRGAVRCSRVLCGPSEESAPACPPARQERNRSGLYRRRGEQRLGGATVPRLVRFLRRSEPPTADETWQ